VTFSRQRRRTLIFMTALAVTFALVASLGIGYHLGRRSGSASPARKRTWKQRTSRVALGKRAIGLVVLVTVRRIQQNMPGQLGVPAATGWGLKFVEPLQLLRSRPPRRRYRY
jgi:hypothetical protein